MEAKRDQVLFVLGATGTGKSKLAIELATRFEGEIINSDKIQVYTGLDVVTNKVTAEEEGLVKHHLLNVVDDPGADFTTEDFRREVIRAVESIIGRKKIPIIAGGSNTYIEALVADEQLRQRYETSFFWLDVDLPVLHSSVSSRVDRMVESGLVEEARTAFQPHGDYSRGVRRAIGVSEMDEYFRTEGNLDAAERTILLEEAINKIRENTCELTKTQRAKIVRFRDVLKWDIHCLDATKVFLLTGIEAEEIWKQQVLGPAEAIAVKFLRKGNSTGDAPPPKMDEETVGTNITVHVPLVAGGLTFPVK